MLRDQVVEEGKCGGRYAGSFSPARNVGAKKRTDNAAVTSAMMKCTRSGTWPITTGVRPITATGACLDRQIIDALNRDRNKFGTPNTAGFAAVSFSLR